MTYILVSMYMQCTANQYDGKVQEKVTSSPYMSWRHTEEWSYSSTH